MSYQTGKRLEALPHLTESREWIVRLGQIKTVLGHTYDDVQRKHTMQLAAGLSYYFVMSFFPLLIMLAASLASFPVGHSKC